MPSATINLLRASGAGLNTEELASFIFASDILLLISMPIALSVLDWGFRMGKLVISYEINTTR